MRKHAKDDKRRWNRRYWTKKRRAGWKFYGFCLPKPIGDELLSLKRQRMEEHRKSQLPGEVETP
jgi:hypothetical protein